MAITGRKAGSSHRKITTAERKPRTTRAKSPHQPAAAPAENAGENEPKPIWEIAAELGAQIPEEEWAKVPSDLSTNLDHYLYGAPKSEE